jgi:FSR family fosmidomycin resistance protein-like MFS transporter
MVAITIRSGLWNVTQLEYGIDYSFLFWLALAAGIGKALGGFAADIIGKTGIIVLAIPSGAFLLALSAGNSWMILPGVALLQSASPAMFTALAGFIPGKPATVSGLALGLAIVSGSISNLEGICSWLSEPDGKMLAALLFSVLPVLFVGQSRSNVSKFKQGENNEEQVADI